MELAIHLKLMKIKAILPGQFKMTGIIIAKSWQQKLVSNVIQVVTIIPNWIDKKIYDTLSSYANFRNVVLFKYTSACFIVDSGKICIEKHQG